MAKWNFRDVSKGIKKLREFLLGRKYVFHHRFPPVIAPRSIPAPQVPRGPEYKYAAQWYGDRDVLNSVKPPVVAPIAEGCKMGARPLSGYTSATGQIKFPSELPTPGCVWWWDAHCYYKEVIYESPCGPPPPAGPCATLPKSPCEEPPKTIMPKQFPCAERKPDVCAPKLPCKFDPCKVVKPEPPKLPEEPCDPCKPPKKC